MGLRELQKWRKGVRGPITGLAKTRGVDNPVDIETFGLGTARVEREGRGEGSCMERLRMGLGREVDGDDTCLLLW